MLPNNFVITPNCGNHQKLKQYIKQNIIGKYNFIGIREYNLNYNELENLILFCKNNFEYVCVFKNFELAKKHDIGIQIGFEEFLKSKKNYNHLKFVGVSCHFKDDLSMIKNVDYICISPVFDSISKKNYKGIGHTKFNKFLENNEELKNKIYALGGITKNNMSLLNINKFAFCGYLFNALK